MNSFPNIPIPLRNIGGGKSFEFIPVTDILTMSKIVNGKITSAITLRSGKSWLDGYSTSETLVFDEQMKQTESGPVYPQTLKGFYPKGTEDISALFIDMRNRRFVLKVTDQNGKIRIMGSVKNPVIFTYDYGTKESASGRNGYNYNFSCTDKNPAPFYII